MANRKMRRLRDANPGFLSGFDLYDQGDVPGSLEAFGDDDRSSIQYNKRLLQQLQEQKLDLHALEQYEEQIRSTTSHKKQRNELIFAYNRALILYSQGNSQACLDLCTEQLKDLLQNKPPKELCLVSSRMALLVLECILNQMVGRHIGVETDLSSEEIVRWLETFDLEADAHLKFLLPLFKSRLEVCQLDENMLRQEANIRSARKEIKISMEVFQHKLRNEATGSVVSSANSEENASGSNSQPQPPPPSSIVLQKMNQSALSLKAHLEQLKGNIKKSGVLCSEAQTATTTTTGSYDALHSNNLAVVYATDSRQELPLYNFAKALRTETSSVSPDGTLQSDQMFDILHNTAICALRARNYLSAYECMANCISRSNVFQTRPGCHLRLAEACIGVFAELKKTNLSKTFSAINVNGTPKGIVLEDNIMFNDDIGVVREELASELASPEDIEQVKRNPLLRARWALEFAVDQADGKLGADDLSSARLSLAFTYLAFGDHRLALEHAKVVLASSEPTEERSATGRMRRRQLATARMYAAEASCELGASDKAMAFLVGDGKDDAFDRLASHLSGVSFETAVNESGKRRLAKAQTMVKSSACTVSATMNNPAAKQLANSANAMEDAYCSSSKRGFARRALIFTLLREGNQSSALNMLLSLR